MDTTDQTNNEVSAKEIVQKIGLITRYLKSQSIKIIAFAIIGGGGGLIYSFVKKPLYTAVSTFVLEEGGKGGGLGQYAGLASLAGIDLGGGGGGGIFQGDNILELYKSRRMLEKTLLSTVNITGKDQLLIDRYINFNDMRKNWKEKDKIDSISFNGDPLKFNRKQDSIITSIIEAINKSVLSVSKLDKKLSIINVVVKTPDELFSKHFNTKLVETVNDFYTQTKTKKSAQNIQILQRQADSVRTVLNSSLGGVAYAVDAAPNANPALSSLRVPSQRKQIDVQANSAIYSEVVKNLEISKISLRQEAPLIQMIDEPVLPLTKTKLGKIKATLMGIILGAFLAIAVLLTLKAYKFILK